jgi:excinuclease ABC subunit A
MFLELKGATTHNLKGFDLKIPLNQLVVITGPSGSGKSSLAFDTIARLAEARLRILQGYATPLGAEEKQTGFLKRPIPPVVSLAQGVRTWYPYKTVSEILAISLLIKTLFAEKGRVRCPKCGTLNELNYLQQVLRWFEGQPEGKRFYLLLPLPETSPQALNYLLSQGFTRYLIDGREVDLSEEEAQEGFKEVLLLLDRIIKEERVLPRLLENLRLSQGINRGRVIFKSLEGEWVSFNLGSSCFSCGNTLRQDLIRCSLCKGRGFKERKPCPGCEGLKFERSSLESKLFSQTLRELLSMNLGEFKGFLLENLKGEERSFWENYLRLLEKAEALRVDYLKLSTPIFELSLGERKLLEILLLFSADLQGVLYIMDEPTLGLDSNRRKGLLGLIREILAQGNSFLVVEHDLAFIREADFLIELGPGAGEKGGFLLRALPVKDYLKDKEALFYPYFERSVSFKEREASPEDFLEIQIEKGKVKILRQGINLFFGETGSEGDKELKRVVEALSQMGNSVIEGEELFERTGENLLIEYLGIWELWREVLLALPSARAKGLTKRHFSFHTKEGLCSACKGKGYKALELETYTLKTLCEECLGKKLNYEVLNLTYRGFKISEILDFTFEEALELFGQILPIKEILGWMRDLKLSYLKLSQKISELSGGERLRVELLRKLRNKSRIDFLTLFYPFQGLSVLDLEELHHFFRKLNTSGVTILIRETHPLAKTFSDNLVTPQM